MSKLSDYEECHCAECCGAICSMEINDKPIGFLLLKKINKNFIIDLIAVEKKFRGKRIASELLRYCEYYLLKNSNSLKITALTQSLNFASKKLYKKGKYYTRKPIKSFHSKTSKHILNARNMYGVNKIGATDELSRKSGCSKSSLAKIINKGEGAYYSSGSRPNQTPQSWGIARLASALTSGKAGAIDYNILMEGCKPGSKGYKMALLSRKKYDKGKRKALKIKL